MKYLLAAIFSFFLACSAFAIRGAREPTIEQHITTQKDYRIPWMPTQKKWIEMKLIGGNERSFQTVTLLHPVQACSVLIPKDGEVFCYWYWQFLPDKPRPIQDNEAVVRLGSYFAWITEQDYCDMVKGTHQMSSPKLDNICRESWLEFFQFRDDLPDFMKLIVNYPFGP